MKERRDAHGRTQKSLLCRLRKTGATGLEPATSGVTGRRSNQLNYAPAREALYRRLEPSMGGDGIEHLCKSWQVLVLGTHRGTHQASASGLSERAVLRFAVVGECINVVVGGHPL